MSKTPFNSTASETNKYPLSTGYASSSSLNISAIPMSSLKAESLDDGVSSPPSNWSNGFSSLQFRALSRRSLSYHRRQLKTSLFCLVVWPILVVILTFILSKLGEDKVDRNLYFRYCVNEADPFNELYFTPLKLSDKDVRRMAEDYNKIVNNKINVAWYPQDFLGLLGFSHKALPCVRWFGDHIPIKNPYENSSLPLQPEPHTHYTPSPAGTWFNLNKAIQDHPLRLARESAGGHIPMLFYENLDSIQQNVFIWYPAHLNRLVGHFPNVTTDFRTSRDAPWPPTDPSIVYKAPETISSTLLGNFPVRYHHLVTAVSVNDDPSEHSGEEGRIDFHNAYRTSRFFYKPSPASVDAAILELIAPSVSPDQDDEKSRILEGGIPFGGLSISTLEMDPLYLRMTMQMAMGPEGGHTSLDSVPAGLRQMITMSQITTSLTKQKYGSNFTITQGFRVMPYEWEAKMVPDFRLDAVAALLFPFGLAFLLPTFVTLLVEEKESRHRMMMVMNGLNRLPYYTVHYLEYMCMQLIMCLVFCLAALFIKIPFITRTEPALLVVLFIVWSHTQTTFAFILASFFSRARKASLVIYFFVALSCIAGSLADIVFRDGVPMTWSIHPLFAFFRIIQIGIMHASMMNGLLPLKFHMLTPGTPVFNGLMIMLGESLIFLLLTGYLDAILPSEYGVARPWHFPVSMWLRSSPCSKLSLYDAETQSLVNDHNPPSKHYKQPSGATRRALMGADADVHAESDRVEAEQYWPCETPLILYNLYHQYPNKSEPALRGVSFGVPKNQVLGLLGPNGAGKSTMIHLLTGLYTPTAGTAFVAGAEIRKDMATVHSRVGVCPQHDILWDDLTIADHLLFYARLRGIPPALEQQAVDSALAGVSLSELRDRQVVGLSGGEKRRVSIAISLLGDNKVIFLDEPSTGLDPEVRRVIWDVVHRIKKGRTVILTTHSMEEADMLSDRICIMTQGRLRCIGSSLHLKEVYGSGFRLNIYSKAGRLEEACQSVEDNLMVGMEYQRIDKFTNASTFEFQVAREQGHRDAGELSKLFHYLNQPGMFPAIEDWSISQATLEDVFVKVVTQGEDAIALPGIAHYTA